MDHSRKRRIRRRILAVLLLVAYPLSVGPVYAMWVLRWIPESAEIYFLPLFWVFYTPLEKPFTEYILWWYAIAMQN